MYLFWLCWIFIAVLAFLSRGEGELLSSCGAQASRCGGFSCCGAQTLGPSGFSSSGFWSLEHRPNSCGTQA